MVDKKSRLVWLFSLLASWREGILQIVCFPWVVLEDWIRVLFGMLQWSGWRVVDALSAVRLRSL